MILELYASGAEHPPLVDAYIDAQGNLYGMAPEPRHEFSDLMQIVLERDGDCPNHNQRFAIGFLMEMNGVQAAYLFLRSTAPTPFLGYNVTQYP